MRRKTSLRDRFFNRLVVGDGCWHIGGALAPNGYSRISREPGTMVYGHRVSYEIFVGPISPGLCIDHLCRNRACVNPSHMEQVTRGENVLRGVGISAMNASKTHCHRGHELVGANLANTPSRIGSRVCRECLRTAAQVSKTWRKQEKSDRCGVTPYWDVYDPSTGSEAAVVSAANWYLDF